MLTRIAVTVGLGCAVAHLVACDRGRRRTDEVSTEAQRSPTPGQAPPDALAARAHAEPEATAARTGKTAVQLPAAPKLGAILCQSASRVESTLGPPATVNDAQTTYRVGPVEFLVTYRNKRACDIVVGGAAGQPVSAEALKSWLGVSGTNLSVNGRVFVVTASDEVVSIADTALPEKRVDVTRVLGRDVASVRRILGPPELALVGQDVFKPWAPDDRIGIIAHYAADGRATWVQIAFDDGVLPSLGEGLSNYATQLQWLGLPVSDAVVVGSERFVLTVDGGSVDLRNP